VGWGTQATLPGFLEMTGVKKKKTVAKANAAVASEVLRFMMATKAR